MVMVVNLDCDCLDSLTSGFMNQWTTKLKLKLLVKGFLFTVLPRAAFSAHRGLDVLRDQDLVQILATMLNCLGRSEISLEACFFC